MVCRQLGFTWGVSIYIDIYTSPVYSKENGINEREREGFHCRNRQKCTNKMFFALINLRERSGNKNGQSKETSNIRYTRRTKTKQNIAIFIEAELQLLYLTISPPRDLLDIRQLYIATSHCCHDAG